MRLSNVEPASPHRSTHPAGSEYNPPRHSPAVVRPLAISGSEDKVRQAARALTDGACIHLIWTMQNSTGPSGVKYKRVVLKLSGEVLRGKKAGGDPIDAETLARLCEQVKEVHDLGVQVCVVIGGGNIFRGLAGEQRGVDRTTGDYMGMLATVINGLAIMDCLEKMGAKVRVQSSIPMNQVAEPFILRRAIRHLEKDRVVVFVAGTGTPYFSTDTAAALRASEIGADILLKATKVDGIYDKDPMKNTDAVRYDEITYSEALRQRLNVMDSTAFSLCQDNNIPILVFNLNDRGAIRRALSGDKVGTLVHS